MALIGLAVEEGNAVVSLQRPPLNILNHEMVQELSQMLDNLSREPAVRTVTLASGIPGVFSAGADVKEHLPPMARTLIEGFVGLCRKLFSYPKPTLALVDGKCLGGGMEVAMVCDYVLASERSVFGQPEVAVGVFPPVGAALYPLLAGVRNANLVLLSGASFDARESLSMGYVTQVVPQTDLASARTRWLQNFSGRSGVVLRLSKQAVLQGLGQPWEKALTSATDLYLGELMSSADAVEGLRAFTEKRKPLWKEL